MLDQFERQYRVEALARVGNRFGCGDPIVDNETGGLRVRLRRVDCFWPSIDTGHREAETGHRLGYEAAAAPDIEQGQSGKRPQLAGISMEMRQQPGPNEAEPSGIQPVQSSKTALRVPPGIGLHGKTAEFSVIDSVAVREHE